MNLPLLVERTRNPALRGIILTPDMIRGKDLSSNRLTLPAKRFAWSRASRDERRYTPIISHQPDPIPHRRGDPLGRPLTTALFVIPALPAVPPPFSSFPQALSGNPGCAASAMPATRLAWCSFLTPAPRVIHADAMSSLSS